ncbi:MAG: Ig-like domain-containing protein, partial [Pseudomonadota bacterium]
MTGAFLPEVGGQFVYSYVVGEVLAFTINFNSDLTYTITPGPTAGTNPNLVLPLAFEYYVSDAGATDLDFGTVDLIRNNGTATLPGEYVFGSGPAPLNLPPVARLTARTVTEDEGVVGFFPNAIDPEGFRGNTTLTVDATGARGSVSVNLTAIGYDTNNQFESLGTGETATDTFTYTINDNGSGTGGVARSSTATVTITITGVNDAPVATGPTFVIPTGAGPRTYVINYSDAEGFGGTPVLTLTGANAIGASRVGPARTDGFTVLYAAGGDTLSPGQTETNQFTYTISDGEASDSATVTFVTKNFRRTTEDADLVLTGLLRGTVDPVDTSATGSGVIQDSDGWKYSPGTAFDFLAFGETAIDTISYSFRERGVRTSGTEEILITGLNDAPTAVNDVLTVPGGSAVVPYDAGRSLLSNDTDPDTNDTLRIVSAERTGSGGMVALGEAITLQQGGTIRVRADGTYQYTPGTAAGTETLTYTILDGRGATSTATFTITLTDLPPALPARNPALTLLEGSEGGTLVFGTDLLGPVRLTQVNGMPVPAGTGPMDGLTLTLSGGPVTFRENGFYVFFDNPAMDTLRGRVVDTLSYEITDSGGNRVSNVDGLTVTFVPVNERPVGDQVALTGGTAADRSVTRQQGQITGFTDPEPFQTLRLVSVDGQAIQPQTGVFQTFNRAYGDWTFYDDLTYTFTPNRTGLETVSTFSESFIFTVDDGANTSRSQGSATVAFTTTFTNDPPVVTTPRASFTTDEDTPIQITLPVTDPENFLGGPSGSAVTWTVPATTNLGSAITNNNDGTVILTPAPGLQSLGATSPPSSESFTYSVTDPGSGATVSGEILVTINGVNDAPTISNLRLSSGIESDRGSSGTFLGITDTDTGTGDVVILSQVGDQAVPSSGFLRVEKPYGVYFFFANRLYTFAPNEAGLAATTTFADSFTVTFADSQGATVTGTTSFTTSFTIDTPVTADAQVSTFEGRTINIRPGIADPENLIGLGTSAGPTIEFDAVNDNTAGSLVSPSFGLFVYSAFTPPGASGPDPFESLGSGQTLT